MPWARSALAIVAMFVLSSASLAGEQWYGYDEFGRVIRMIDEQNRVTDYTYDAAGNIIRIKTDIQAQAPTVSSISPDSLRRTESKVFTATGTNLLGARVTSDDPNLIVSGVQTMVSTDTSLSFTVSAASTAVMGSHTLTFTTGAGSATATVTVNPVLPTLYTMPAPLAVPPDSVQRHLTLRLSNADTISHTINISAADPTIVTIAANATIAAGQTEVPITITGLKAGQTLITFASPTLGTTSYMAYVSTDYQEMDRVRAQSVGVVVQVPPPTPQPIAVSPVVGAAVGVVVQQAPVTPPPTTVSTIVSASVGVVVQQVPVVPPPVTVSPIISSAVGVIVPQAVTTPGPVSVTNLMAANVGTVLGSAVTSMSPMSASVGKTATLTIYGNELQSVTAVQVLPNNGITIGTPVIAADGNSLTVDVSIAASTPQKPVYVQVLAGTTVVPAANGQVFLLNITP